MGHDCRQALFAASQHIPVGGPLGDASGPYPFTVPWIRRATLG